MNYNEQNFDSRGRQTDLVLAVNEFTYVLNKSTGVIKSHVGPSVVTVGQQEALVLFDSRTKRFIETNDYNRAKQLFVSAPEGWYVVLKNPAETHPEAGHSNNTPAMQVGIKVNIAGPTSFALFPGQMAKVIRGHKLRTNQYLLARVYDADAAMASANSATVLNAEGKAVDMKKENYFVGQLLVIKGTEVSFYIPPTGIEVLSTENDANEYVRDAITLERLEYCILKDENGSKSYHHGPAVVFPKPTETFVQTPQKTVIFRAIELSEISGIYIKVIADYEENGVKHPIGEELFITGETQKIYYPRPEHAMIQYDGKYMHHAIAIPMGEGRYILNRLTGEVKTVVGPAMYLPDPRTEVVVKRVLTPQECELFYPGNREVLEYNLGLSETQAEKDSRMGKTNKTDVINNAYSTSNQEKTLAIFAANANISRGTSYTKPRTIVLDTKYEGVVTVSPWTGYAVNVVSKSGKREIIVGPATRMLNYDETLEVVSLSTGKPKSTDRLISTAYLRVDNNKVSDIVIVQTKDYVDVALKVSYNVNFLKEYKDKWFCVDNYVKFLCDKMRSDLKSAAKKYGIEEFYASTTEIVKKTVLGENGAGYVFESNGMCVNEVEVLNVEVEAAIAKMLNRHQQEMVAKMLELSDAARKTEMVKELAEFDRKETELNYQTQMYRIKLDQETQLKKLENEAALAEQRRKEECEAANGKAAVQVILSAIHEEQLKRDRAADDQKIQTERQLAEIEKAKNEEAAKNFVSMFKAISPDLVAALESKANAQIMDGLAKAVAPYAIAGNESVSAAVTRLLKGTTLEETLGKLGTFNSEKK